MTRITFDQNFSFNISRNISLALLISLALSEILNAASPPRRANTQSGRENLPTTAQGQNQSAAERKFEEGEALRAQWTPESLRLAVKKYEEALCLGAGWRQLLGQAGTTPAVQGDQGAQSLVLGQPIERELAGGQGHAYQITLSAGQFMKVIVEQRGIDVVVGLLGPDAKQIMEFDSEIRIQGQETVWQVAEVAGSYRMNVKAKHKGAPAGGYESWVWEVQAG